MTATSAATRHCTLPARNHVFFMTMKSILFLSLASLAATLYAQAPSRSPTGPALAPQARTPLHSSTVAPPLVAGNGARPGVPPQLTQSANRELPQRVLFDRPFGEGGDLWALGHAWKGSFDSSGFTFIPFFGSDAPRNFPLRLQLASARVGEVTLPLVAGNAVLDGTVVKTNRGSCVETVATDLLAVEQSFVFDTLPNRGDLAIDIVVQGEFDATTTDHGIEFRNPYGRVTYTKAVAVDSLGVSLPLQMTWDGDSVHVTIPADFVAKAHLPLVLDPILTTVSTPTGVSAAQRQPDVATLQSPDRSLVVWERQFSANDWDCFVDVHGPDLTFVAGNITVDFTFWNWQHPKAASNMASDSFMVVAQIDAAGGNPWIGGRVVTWTGIVSFYFDIERDGVVGLPGYNYTPDIGGDAWTGGGGVYYCVVWEHTTAPANNSDIHFKLVRPDGTLPDLLPRALTITAEDESAPAISKDDRQDRWWVAFQKNYPNPPFDQDIWSACIQYDGLVIHAPFLVSSFVSDELRPCVTSAATPEGGAPVHLIVWEMVNSPFDSDLWCAAFQDGATPTVALNSWNLSLTEASGAFAARPQTLPKADSDGNRFVIGHSEYNGTDYDTFVSTIAYVPSTNDIRFDETRVALGTTFGVDDYWTNTTSYYSGGNLPSPEYVIAGAKISNNTIGVWEYGGYQPGAFFSTFLSQCGVTSPTITPTGTPVLGSTVTFTVSSPVAGIMFGLPGAVALQPLIGCNCILGIDLTGLVTTGSPLSITLPNNPLLVGSTWSVQGFGVSGSNCLGLFDLTHTIDFTIR